MRAPDYETPPSLREKCESAMRSAGVPVGDPGRFKENPTVVLDVVGTIRTQEVSYGVKNNRWHYLQQASFDPQSPRRSGKDAHHIAFIFEHARESANGHRAIERDAKVVLYDDTDLSEANRPLLDLIIPLAQAIDVSDPDAAADQLRAALAL